MKSVIVFLFSCLTFLFTGCTSLELKQNTMHHGRTVGDLIAAQVLYNLALAHEYYSPTNTNRFNGIPTFVALTTGGDTVTDSGMAQFPAAFPLKGTGVTLTPQASGSHQVADNWSFSPVVDPSQLHRLYYLYMVQFKFVADYPAVMKIIFPDVLDSNGKPKLIYNPRMAKGTSVAVDSNNQPIFDVTYQPTNHPPTDVPGALTEHNAPSGEDFTTNGWFSLKPVPIIAGTNFYAGSYLGQDIWITNKGNFFRFAMLTLGSSTNSFSTTAMPFLQFNNGVLSPLPYMFR